MIQRVKKRELHFIYIVHAVAIRIERLVDRNGAHFVKQGARRVAPDGVVGPGDDSGAAGFDRDDRPRIGQRW